MTDYQTAYLDRFAEAVIIAREKGAVFCALAACAQGAWESGWGRSELAIRCNNLFGVKATLNEAAWEQWTWEYGARVGDRPGYYRIMARWRKYPSYNEAIVDYAAIIGTLSWFDHARPHADPPAGDGNATLWLAGLMWPGLFRWATEAPSTYVSDVVSLFPAIGDLTPRLQAAQTRLTPPTPPTPPVASQLS